MHRTMSVALFSLLMLATCVAWGCAPSDTSEEVETLRLATTTSTRDSGLLDVLLPPFERAARCRVETIAVGTGAALRLGSAGDVDAVMVHAREAEEAFLAAGHATRHEEFMANGFLLLGPSNDPARVKGTTPTRALERLAAARAPFVSRGDDSGTHKRERKLLAEAGVVPWSGFVECGQGMGAALLLADEQDAYVLCDLGTYLNRADDLRLVPLVAGHAALRNPYAVMPVSARRHSGVREDLAQRFADYLVSREAQELIAGYRVGGQVLFEPLRLDVTSSER